VAREATMTNQDDKEREEPTETTPGGLEVRTPGRDEFFGNLRRVSKPDEDDGSEPEERGGQ
jgi:hypothetical protein